MHLQILRFAEPTNIAVRFTSNAGADL